jgi:hypothetical protein
MRRFGGFAVGLLLLSIVGSSSSAANLAAYRCVGIGTLTATFTPGPSPPSTAGYTWSLTASGACVASPDGPWIFTATGGGNNGSCGSVPAVTATTARPYEPFVVRFALTNPRTGATRTQTNAWYFTGSALAYVVSIRSATSVPSCSSPVIGGPSGFGALVRGLDPSPAVTGAPVESYPATFAVHFR